MGRCFFRSGFPDGEQLVSLQRTIHQNTYLHILHREHTALNKRFTYVKCALNLFFQLIMPIVVCPGHTMSAVFACCQRVNRPLVLFPCEVSPHIVISVRRDNRDLSN